MKKTVDVVETIQSQYENYLRCKKQKEEQEYIFIPDSSKEVENHAKREGRGINR